ncbi:hypothetical protein V3C99_011831 [Haemonchus contortus]
MLLSDIKKEEADDVIDITQLLPHDDTEDNLFPIQPASPFAEPIPFRTKKCSSAHSHFRLAPPLPGRYPMTYSALQRRRQFPDRFPYSNDDDESTSDGPTFRAGHPSQRPPIMLNFKSKPRNKQTPGTVRRNQYRISDDGSKFTQITAEHPSPIHSRSPSPPRTLRELCETFLSPEELERLNSDKGPTPPPASNPPISEGTSKSSNRPRSRQSSSSPCAVEETRRKRPRISDKGSRLTQPTTSATETRQLLPPSPPPIPTAKPLPQPERLPGRLQQITSHKRPPSSFPLFPVRLVRSVELPEDLPSTSFEGDSLHGHNQRCPVQDRYPGTREISMFRKHDVLRHTIPGGEKCYIFLFKRTNHSHDVYRCRECKKRGLLVTVKVIGDNFLSDPCDEPHVCDPVDYLKDKVERLVYKKWREMQQNPRYADSACREVWKEMLDAFDDESLGDVEEREKMRIIYESSGYDNRRTTIARNIRRLRRMMYKEALAQAEEGDDSVTGDDEASNSALDTDKELAEDSLVDAALCEESNTEESQRSPSSSYIEKLVKTEKSD